MALNLALWFAAPGLALRQAVIDQLFGPKMVRLEVLEKTTVDGSTDWHIDRGVIVSVNSSQLVLREADGRMQTIPLSTSTKVIRFGRHLLPSQLAPRWHVLVTWPATGPAQSVDVERVSRTPAATGYGRSAAPMPPPILRS